MVNSRRFGMGPRRTLSKDMYFETAENVDVISSALFRLYRARLPFLGVELRASNMAVFGLRFLTRNCAFKNLKTVF